MSINDDDNDNDEGGDDEYHREGILRGVLGRSWGPPGAFWSCLRPFRRPSWSVPRRSKK